MAQQFRADVRACQIDACLALVIGEDFGVVLATGSEKDGFDGRAANHTMMVDCGD
jgi:hypothetical protein